MNIIKPFQPAKGIVPTVRSISTLSGNIQGEFPDLSDSELTYKQDSAATGELLHMLLEALKQFRAQSGGSISISNSTSVIRNNICSIVNNFRSAAGGSAGLELLLKKIGEVFSAEAPSPQSAELLIKQLSGQIENMGISPAGHAALVSELRGGISGSDMERAYGNILKKNYELTARLYSGKIHIHRLFDGESKAGDTSGTSSSRGGSPDAAAGISGSAEIGRDSLKRVFSSFKAALLRGVRTELIMAASANTANTAISAFTSITAITAKGADHSAENKAASKSPRSLRGALKSTVWAHRNDSISRGGNGGCKRLTELAFSSGFTGSDILIAGRENTASGIPAGIGAAYADKRSYPESAAGSMPPAIHHSGEAASELFTQLSVKLFTRLSAKLPAQLSGKPSGETTEIIGGSAGAAASSAAAISDVSAVHAAFYPYSAYSSDFAYAVTSAKGMKKRFRNTLAARSEYLGQVKVNTLFYFQDIAENTKWYYSQSNESTSLRNGNPAAKIPPVSGGADMTARSSTGTSRSESPVIPETPESQERREIRESFGNQEKPSFVMAAFTRNYAPELIGGLLTEKTTFRLSVPENLGGEKHSVTSVSSLYSLSSEMIYLNRYSLAGMVNGEDASSAPRRTGGGGSSIGGAVTPHGNPQSPAYTEKPHTVPDGELSRGQARTIYNILAERTSIGGAVSSGDRTEYGEIGKVMEAAETTNIADILKIAAKAENAANILKSNLFRSADNMESAKPLVFSKPVDLTELFKFTESTGAAEFTAYSGNAGKTEDTYSMKTAEKHGRSISAKELFRSLVLKEKAVAAGELLRYRKANPSGISASFPDIDITLRSTGSPGFSHFSLMPSVSELNEAGHSAFSPVFHPARKWTPSRAGFASGCVVVLDGRQPVCVLRLTGHKSHSELKSTFSPDGALAAHNPLTGLTDPTALATPISPNELNELNKVNVSNLSNVLNASNVLNELNKLTAQAASVLRSKIRGGLSERIVFSEKSDMLNIRSVSEISRYFLEHAVNDFLRLRSKRREMRRFTRLTDISGTPGFNEPVYSARHTENAPAGHEQYDSAGGANHRKREYLRSVRTEFIHNARAQNFLEPVQNPETRRLHPPFAAKFSQFFSKYIQYVCEKMPSSGSKIRAHPTSSEILNRLLNRKTFSVSPEQYRTAFSGNISYTAAVEANRYIGGNIYRTPAWRSENLLGRASALSVYKPESAGAEASPEKPVYPASVSVSGAFPIILKGFTRRLILMECWNSGDTESLITGNAPHKSSLMERFPDGGGYLAAEYADRKSRKNGKNGTNGIIEQNSDVYRGADTISSSAGGENTLYYYSAGVPEKSGENSPELPAHRDIPDKGGKGAEMSDEPPLPPAEKIYSQLNISERVSSLLSSEEAMKSYIMNQINSYFSENNSHNVNSLIQNQYNSAETLCEQVISRLERRLKTERRINGR